MATFLGGHGYSVFSLWHRCPTCQLRYQVLSDLVPDWCFLRLRSTGASQETVEEDSQGCSSNIYSGLVPWTGNYPADPGPGMEQGLLKRPG